jgi:hypothetical protein
VESVEQCGLLNHMGTEALHRTVFDIDGDGGEGAAALPAVRAGLEAEWARCMVRPFPLEQHRPARARVCVRACVHACAAAARRLRARARAGALHVEAAA